MRYVIIHTCTATDYPTPVFNHSDLPLVMAKLQSLIQTHFFPNPELHWFSDHTMGFFTIKGDDLPVVLKNNVMSYDPAFDAIHGCTVA